MNQEILEQQPLITKKIYSFRSHSLSIATLGCLILWLGWFGFNAGSTLSANSTAIAHILLNTVIAGATGSLGSLIGAWIYFEKPSIAFLINGILGGCVSITASCAFVGLPSAAIIGFIGGILVNLATAFLDKCGIDDPVGAVPIHLGCGFWGTFAVGLFSEGANVYPRYGITNAIGPETGIFLANASNIKQSFLNSLVPQAIGLVSVILYAGLISWLAWSLVDKISEGRLRIPENDERNGTDPGFLDAS